MVVRRIALMEEVKKKRSMEKERALPPEAKAAAYLAAWAKEREAKPESESRSDWHAYQARLARDSWNTDYAAAGHYGSYETITTIPAMRFTDHLYDSAGPRETLQIFSIKVAGIKEGVSWPLYVYGTLAVRDTVDHNRNVIFDRQRDNCQTVPEELYLKMFVCKPLGKESFE
ncbi:hypothetical protein ACQ4PT_027560 [Festuca glaucescens]